MVLLEAPMGRPPPFHVSSFQGPSLWLALIWSLACPPTVPSQTGAVPTMAVITEGLAWRSALAAGMCLVKVWLGDPTPTSPDHLAVPRRGRPLLTHPGRGAEGAGQPRAPHQTQAHSIPAGHFRPSSVLASDFMEKQKKDFRS